MIKRHLDNYLTIIAGFLLMFMRAVNHISYKMRHVSPSEYDIDGNMAYNLRHDIEIEMWTYSIIPVIVGLLLVIIGVYRIYKEEKHVSKAE